MDSCNEDEFNKAKTTYDDALKSSGYTQQAFPTTNADKMIDQVETASVTLSGIMLL